MADSFRKRAYVALSIARRSPFLYPIRPSRVRAKLLIAFILPFTAIGCKGTPAGNTPPDVIKTITMKKWSIEPSRIEVPQGDEVELVVSSTDVEHGIAISKLGILETVQPGKPAIVKFRAKDSGVYAMSCSVLCGKGHDQMTGVIVVTPAVAK
jgi:cytochrome c oxidase subunit II